MYSLAGLSVAAVATGQNERAVKMMAGVEELREEMGAVLETEDRIPYEHAVAAAREQLREEAFGQLWQEGRAMSMEQAIE